MLIERYIPPLLRTHGNLKNEQFLFEVTKSRKSGPKRLHLTGTIKNKDITILVDSGSTHNLIDINKAKELILFVFPAKELKASTIVDQNVEEVEKCHQVSLQIQNLHLQLNCISLPLKEIDMVLGADWLASLGTYSTNLQKQYMEFKWNGSEYRLYGLNISQPNKKSHNTKRTQDSHQDQEINSNRIFQI